GRPEKSRVAELGLAAAACPLLIVQGAHDPFGRPNEFPPPHNPSPVPYADHAFAVPKRAPLTQEAALGQLTAIVSRWLAAQGLATP
ncbi:hypothetical protein GA0115240_10651, partial [Streptomyces sp. DvalAA-14]|uniref:alpha/beta family hydrolase n=1 Tax=unclassified Streptomyces TaxID=2593676 RepID=UPI00081BAB26